MSASNEREITQAWHIFLGYTPRSIVRRRDEQGLSKGTCRNRTGLDMQKRIIYVQNEGTADYHWGEDALSLLMVE